MFSGLKTLRGRRRGGFAYPADQFPVNGDAIHLASLHSLSRYLKYLTFLRVGESVHQHSCSIYMDCGFTSLGSPAPLPLPSPSNLAAAPGFPRTRRKQARSICPVSPSTLHSLPCSPCAVLWGMHCSYGDSFIPCWAPPGGWARC